MNQPPVLRLPAAGLRRMREHACAAWPEEACGLLAGSSTGNRVMDVRVCLNVAMDRERGYEIDPETFLRIEHAGRRSHRTVIGVWHSHPHGDARPSARDLAEAWPGWSYVILGVTREGVTGLDGWRLDGERFVRQPVHIVKP